MRYLHKADLMLGHRLRRWPNIKPALGESPMFAEMCMSSHVAHSGVLFTYLPYRHRQFSHNSTDMSCHAI